MMANAKTDASSATAADRAQKLVARPGIPTNADLTERAYEHYWRVAVNTDTTWMTGCGRSANTATVPLREEDCNVSEEGSREE